jgi:hypothetical protein
MLPPIGVAVSNVRLRSLNGSLPTTSTHGNTLTSVTMRTTTVVVASSAPRRTPQASATPGAL